MESLPGEKASVLDFKDAATPRFGNSGVVSDRFEETRLLHLQSVQSALSDLKRPPERLQSQCNYRLFIT